MQKVTFARPGESQEQEGVFIAVERSLCRMKDARQTARVEGTLHVFAQADKMPFGYLSKCIASADPADTFGFFFRDFEENVGTFQNLCEKKVGFNYLFDSQYDPAIGTITEVDLSYPETE